METAGQNSSPAVVKRRKFRIQSKFGEPRQWRSRKSRPCDACRRRKTACVIDCRPPCRFCESKGLECQATASVSTETTFTPEPSAGVSTPTNSAEGSIAVSPQPPGQDIAILGGEDEVSISESTLPPYSLSAQRTYLPSITVLADAAASLEPVQLQTAGLSPPWSVADVSLTADAEASTLTEVAPVSRGISLGLLAPFHDGETPANEPAPRTSVGTSGLAPPTSTEPGSQSALTATSAPVPSVVTSPQTVRVYTLEDNPKRTAHSMGMAGEQDAELMASFRSSVVNEANQVDADILQVFAGDLGSNQPPVHFNMLHDNFAPLDNTAKNAASERIESAVAGNADELVRLYFRHVHPVYPVLAKTRFLEVYFGDANDEDTSDTISTPGTSISGIPSSPMARSFHTRPGKLSIPASVRGVVYGLASNFWKRDPANASFPLNQHELFEDALASLQREFHGPNLWTLQACLLLIHENSAENATIETPRVWTLAAQAVACAQVIGLHRDPKNWSIAPWEKSLRIKLWWATFSADLWSSVCHGNPPHVYRESYTTPLLTMDDLTIDEDVPRQLARHLRLLVDPTTLCTDVAACARLFQTVAVSRIVHELLHSSFSDVVYLESMQNPLAREAGLLQIRQKLKNWASLLPRCIDTGSLGSAVHNNAPVHLGYYAAVALNFRALMSPVTKAAKQDPQSSLRRYFRLAIDDFRPFIDFMHNISPVCMHAFWGLHARSQLILCGNFFIYLFLLAPDPEYVQDAFQLLGKFHDSLQRLSAVADKFAISILRPVALRIDSFFTQAAQIMRSGQQADCVPISPHVSR
ncbi:fungal specific transcription factor domain-containing protein [Ophiostoma piceae UAMH 11346]|uniref:Fungal specific transcription factor domain-containing protein n=1 Tax=Ophiostoma piceae (strain UAMH 11346) TaxID=1262450 RepID=S3BP38_OPHP1|nr:fungal specific transcription factor domain-containing protein [Ophiostoma piceae UAMH 11346]